MAEVTPVEAALQEIVARVVEGERLRETEARAVFEGIMDGRLPPVRLAALLVALRMRGETVEEITGFARVMRERATRVLCDAAVVLDTCGTGGDGAGTFNISTVAALVVAACGVTVAKHGNRSAGGRCGSADLLEGLGVRLEVRTSTVERSLREAGIGFLFAPGLHQAMRHAAPVRRELGLRTVFNLLGPLTNPAGARHQLLGVYDPQRVETLARVLKELGSERALVVHGDGLDEIALHGRTRAAELHRGEVRLREIAPEDAGLGRARLQDLKGGDVARNVGIARGILGGDRGPCRDVVLLNAAAALTVAGAAADLKEGAERAAEGIDSGGARRLLERVRLLHAEDAAAS